MMVGQTDIDDVDLFWAARVGSCDHSVEHAAKLMRRARVVEQQPLRLNELTKLDGERVVRAVKPDVVVADDVHRLLVCDDAV